jgi:hypothetical protein
MLLKLFKSNLPYVIFLIPVLAFVMWLPLFFTDSGFGPHNEGALQTPVFRAVFQLFNGNTLIMDLAGLVLLVLQAYIIVRLNFKFIFLETKTYLPAVLFIVFSSALGIYQGFTPSLVANVFFLLALDKALFFSKERNELKRYFESGLFLGIAFLFYPQVLVFLLYLVLTQFILRTFYWRELVVCCLGVLVPVGFLLATSWFFDMHQPYVDFLQAVLDFKPFYPELSLYQLAALILIGFIVLIALLFSLQLVGLKKISTRKYFSLFLWYILIGMAFIFTIRLISYEVIYFIALPMAVLVSFFFIELRKTWFAETVFAILLLAVIATMYL